MRVAPLPEAEFLAFLDGLPEAPPLSETARQVLRARYLQRDAEGEPTEDFPGLVARVAHHVAGAEPPARRSPIEALFARMMATRVFLPNSPTLMNAGLPDAQLAACFVLPVADSIVDIFGAVRDMALVQKTGGGTGFSFSDLRPAGDEVSSTKGISSGPLTFMEVFNAATDSIKQGGKRRGANMGVLQVHHPDVLRFITLKTDAARLTNFNLSVGLTEAFLDAVAESAPYRLVNPRTGTAQGTLSASRVFALLSRCAWYSGEPGVLFLDRINADNPTPQLGQIASTNPCGELPLLPWESCNLGSLNLWRFVQDGTIRWAALGAAVHAAVRFLDNVIDTTAFPLAPVADATRATRKIGLGVMGFADLLASLGIPYDDDEALAVADRVMSYIAQESRRASERLAAARGPFPAFAASRDGLAGAPPRRNATTTTIAPTGTLSILAGCSAGIEPLFAPAYERRFLDGRQVAEVHPLFLDQLRAHGLDTPAVIERVAAAGRATVPGIPPALARLFVTAHEVPARRHVEIQAAFQRHVDNSVSKTVNLPEEASPEDVADLVLLAHRLGCKGLTVYRDGSRPDQVLSSGATGSPDPGVAPADAPDTACPDCGAPLQPAGPFQVCYRCAWND